MADESTTPPAASGAGAPTGRRTIVVAVAIVLMVAAVAVALEAGHHGGGGNTAAAATGHGSSAGEIPIYVSTYACATGWVAPRAGLRTFETTNHGTVVQEVELAYTGTPEQVVGQVETLGPGTSRSISIQLGPGRYVWSCTSPAGYPIESAVGVVSGRGPSGPTLEPVTKTEMLQAILTAQGQIEAGLVPLAADTDALKQTAAGGDRAATEASWLVAHLDYERLGDAYDSFGQYADEIDGRPNGLPGGVDNPQWAGFLRMEYALWHGQPMSTVVAIADQLDTAVHALQVAYPVVDIDPTDIPIRVHEILENALQFQLTGEADQGSHTTLATVRANVDGTRAALAALAPLIETRSPALLATATNDLDRVASALDQYETSPGSWTPLASLSRGQREQLDAVVDQAVEDLANLPDVLELSKESD